MKLNDTLSSKDEKNAGRTAVTYSYPDLSSKVECVDAANSVRADIKHSRQIETMFRILNCLPLA